MIHSGGVVWRVHGVCVCVCVCMACAWRVHGVCITSIGVQCVTCALLIWLCRKMFLPPWRHILWVLNDPNARFTETLRWGSTVAMVCYLWLTLGYENVYLIATIVTVSVIFNSVTCSYLAPMDLSDRSPTLIEMEDEEYISTYDIGQSSSYSNDFPNLPAHGFQNDADSHSGKNPNSRLLLRLLFSLSFVRTCTLSVVHALSFSLSPSLLPVRTLSLYFARSHSLSLSFARSHSLSLSCMISLSLSSFLSHESFEKKRGLTMGVAAAGGWTFLTMTLVTIVLCVDWKRSLPLRIGRHHWAAFVWVYVLCGARIANMSLSVCLFFTASTTSDRFRSTRS